MKLLITGFAPFGGRDVNPSYEAIKLLPDVIDGVQLVKVCLPVEYDRMNTLLSELIDVTSPDAVICVGQAAGRRGITPELVAINFMDGTSPDNAGIVKHREPIVSGGEPALFTTLPVYDMLDALRSEDIPAYLSLSAGSYVCNALMYSAIRLASKASVPVGFIHVPLIKEQVSDGANTFSMELSDVARGLEICIKTLAKKPQSSTVYL